MLDTLIIAHLRPKVYLFLKLFGIFYKLFTFIPKCIILGIITKKWFYNILRLFIVC